MTTDGGEVGRAFHSLTLERYSTGELTHILILVMISFVARIVGVRYDMN